MTSRVHATTFSCRDPYALAAFWAQVLDGRLADDDAPGDPEASVRTADGTLLFVRADALGPGNRVHLDLQPATTRDEEVERLLGLGARRLHDRRRPDGSGWVVLADPEGNELCVERSAAERGQTPPHTGDRELPPVRDADERTMLLAVLDWYREGVLRKVSGVATADARTSPLRSGTTIAGLVKHLAYVEDTWLTERVAGLPVPEPWASGAFADDPDWEFHSASAEQLAQTLRLYEAACGRSRAAVAGRALDDGFVDQRGDRVSLRFVLLHLVEETARHLGHLDVLRELADGSTGE